MEADLQRFYGVDYRDRWRIAPDGRALLTLRRICVLVVRHAPLDAAVTIAANNGMLPWTRTHHQLDDLRQTIENVNTGKKHKPKPHPDRPDGRKHKAEQRARDPQHKAKRDAALRRKRERARAIAAGEITHQT